MDSLALSHRFILDADVRYYIATDTRSNQVWIEKLVLRELPVLIYPTQIYGRDPNSTYVTVGWKYVNMICSNYHQRFYSNQCFICSINNLNS